MMKNSLRLLLHVCGVLLIGAPKPPGHSQVYKVNSSPLPPPPEDSAYPKFADSAYNSNWDWGQDKSKDFSKKRRCTSMVSQSRVGTVKCKSVPGAAPGQWRFDCSGVDPDIITVCNENTLWLQGSNSQKQVIDVDVPNYRVEELIRAGYVATNGENTLVNVRLKRPHFIHEAQIDQNIDFEGSPVVNLQYEPINRKKISFPYDRQFTPLESPLIKPGETPVQQQQQQQQTSQNQQQTQYPQYTQEQYKPRPYREVNQNPSSESPQQLTSTTTTTSKPPKPPQKKLKENVQNRNVESPSNQRAIKQQPPVETSPQWNTPSRDLQVPAVDAQYYWGSW